MLFRSIRGIPTFQVDAFTNHPFAGNPAAVCLLDKPKDEQWMQSVAKEMNLPETAFVCRLEDGYNLRWFTPEIEIDLCGHATLASAHVLFEEGWQKADQPIRFYSHSGLLTAVRLDGWIELNLPAIEEKPYTTHEVIESILGVEAKYVDKTKNYLMVEVETETEVYRLNPDPAQVMTLPALAVIVTSAAKKKEYDYVLRFFAPKAGIIEDPVTGSAQCCLGPYWKKRLKKNEI